MTALQLPDFVIIGAQKSASTFIQDALSRHPAVYMPKGETRFFEDPEYGDGDLSRLSALFAGHENKIKGIKRPDYFGRAEVPARIREAVPAARIIVVLRNPVDRLVSAYYYYVKLGFLPVVDINIAVPKMLNGEFPGSRKSLDLLDYGRYATHLKRYLAHFPREQVLMLMQEDVATSPQSVLAATCNFVGIDPAGVRESSRKSNIGVYPLARLRFLTRRNKYLYDYDDASGKLIDKKMSFGRYLAAAAITATDRYVLARTIGNRKPELKDNVKSMLARYYLDEVKETEDIVGRDLEGWK